MSGTKVFLFFQTHIMGGFFLNVRELLEGGQQGDDSYLTLPTVDEEGEDISPLSE